jgi:hypothetical protein
MIDSLLRDARVSEQNGWKFYAKVKVQEDAALAAIPIAALASVAQKRPAGSMHVLRDDRH